LEETVLSAVVVLTGILSFVKAFERVEGLELVGVVVVAVAVELVDNFVGWSLFV